MQPSLLTLSSDVWAGSTDVSDEGSRFAEEMHLIQSTLQFLLGKNVDAVTFCTVTRGGLKVIEIM